ncbi:MAG: secretin N-terminal domain-containing protein [Chitinophagales bacterium]
MVSTRRFMRQLALVSVLALLAAAPGTGALAAAAQPTTITPVSSEQAPPEQTISLELKGTDIRDVLDAVAKLTGTNIVADESVKGNITVTLNEVPFQQALDLIIKANGFQYKWVGNVLVVAKATKLDEALETAAVQTFPLKHAKPADLAKALALFVPPANIIVDERTKSLVVKGTPAMLSSTKQMLTMLDVEEAPVTRVFPLKSQVTEGLRLAVEAAVPDGEVKVGPAGRSLIVTATPTELAEVDRIVTNLDKEEVAIQVFPLRYASPDEIRATVEAAVPGGSVTIGPGGKSLVVKGSRSQMAQVEKIVAGMDQAAAPLEVKGPGPVEAPPLPPLEVKTYALKYAAVEDVKAALSLVVPSASIQVGRKDRVVAIKGDAEAIKRADRLVAQLDVPVKQLVIEARIEEIGTTGSKKLGLDWTFPLTFVKDPLDVMQVQKVVSDFSATLQALEEQGDATVLANPRIAALDGKEASIHIGDRIPVMVEKTKTENNITTTEKVVEYIQVGVILKVTPRFNEDNSVTLEVNPDVSSITGQTPQGYPSIRTRSAQTTMRVKLGETVALGGLISSNETDGLRKTPLLGDIPILGSIFQTKTKEKRQTEVVIFLTPRVAETAPAGK